MIHNEKRAKHYTGKRNHKNCQLIECRNHCGCVIYDCDPTVNGYWECFTCVYVATQPNDSNEATEGGEN